MLTNVQFEVDSRKLGGCALLLPLKDGRLAPVTPEEVRQYMVMARGKLQDAMESPIYICGVAPTNPDDPCYAIFLFDTTLD